ncbi:hypothetical protein IT084_09165 [Desulfallas sp. Bu1-1]|jgi:hypothetical protein|uniref:hypothetical protein n=1 Tax=Desulfallas sp. Bu1-1 TaxID=2787620 RepID=UPI0018A07EC5|nr:hypothetical protein [Desulfallas sp. Bu1-1]MBF7083141.1 hypothetical protein [Desulfallas sp. Bu1-1]
MEQDREFALEFSEDTLAIIEEFGRKTGRNDEQVVEYIIREYLMHQLPVLEKQASETGKDLNELINLQFVRLLEFLLSKANE